MTRHDYRDHGARRAARWVWPVFIIMGLLLGAMFGAAIGGAL